VRWPLSLLFRGDRDASAPASADAGTRGPGAPGTGAPGEEPPAASPAGLAARPAAWRSLPPVQRAAGAISLTAPASEFGRQLAGRRAPHPILQPLGHDVAADGPAGLVSGIATPLVASAPPAPLDPDGTGFIAPVSVQRRERTTSIAGPPAPPSSDPGAESVAPQRELPVVTAPSAPRALGATRVDVAGGPEPVRAVAPVARRAVQRSTAASEAGGAAGSGGPAPTEPTAAAAAPSPRPEAAQPGDAPALVGGDATGGPLPITAQRRTLGESRRLGLGAPLATRPPSLDAPTAPLLPLARPGDSSGLRGPSRAPSPAVPPDRPATAAPAPLPVLRHAAGGGAVATAPGSAGTASADAVSTPAALAAFGEESAAVAGAEPPTAAPVQRSADRPLVGDPGRRPQPPAGGPGTDAAGEGAPGTAGELPPAPFPGSESVTFSSARAGEPGAPPTGAVAAASPGAPAATTKTLPAGGPAATAGATAPLVIARSIRGSGPGLWPALATVPDGPAPVPVRRSGDFVAVATGHAVPGPATSGGPTAGLRGADGVAGSAIPPLQRFAAGRSEAPSTGGGASSLATPSAPGPVRASGAQPGGRPGAMPVARLATAHAVAGDASSASSEPMALSRLAGTGGPAPGVALGRVLAWTAGAGFGSIPVEVGPVVQRAVEVGEVSSAVVPEPAGDAGPGGAGPGGAPQDYEEIADRVYDRIRSRFATELLLDRERMGLLIDG